MNSHLVSNATAVGIDIGGTKTAVGAVDAQGRIVARTVFPTQPEAGFDPAIERMAAAVGEVATHAGAAVADLTGVGIGCPGPIDPQRGTVHNPYTLPTWDDRNLVAALRERLGVRVAMENDADAALLGEAWVGAARGCRQVVMLTFGTGVGGGALVGGRVYRGVDGAHPELGHLAVEADGPPCYCGRRGCLEALASGTAIGELGKAAGWPDARAVFAAHAQGAPEATAVVNRAVRAVEAALWTLCHAFVPEVVVLGGGVMADHFDRFAGPARTALAQVTQIPRDRVRILPAALGGEAGVVGAAALARASLER